MLQNTPGRQLPNNIPPPNSDVSLLGRRCCLPYCDAEKDEGCASSCLAISTELHNAISNATNIRYFFEQFFLYVDSSPQSGLKFKRIIGDSQRKCLSTFCEHLSQYESDTAIINLQSLTKMILSKDISKDPSAERNPHGKAQLIGIMYAACYILVANHIMYRDQINAMDFSSAHFHLCHPEFAEAVMNNVRECKGKAVGNMIEPMLKVWKFFYVTLNIMKAPTKDNKSALIIAADLLSGDKDGIVFTTGPDQHIMTELVNEFFHKLAGVPSTPRKSETSKDKSKKRKERYHRKPLNTQIQHNLNCLTCQGGFGENINRKRLPCAMAKAEDIALRVNDESDDSPQIKVPKHTSSAAPIVLTPIAAFNCATTVCIPQGSCLLIMPPDIAALVPDHNMRNLQIGNIPYNHGISPECDFPINEQFYCAYSPHYSGSATDMTISTPDSTWTPEDEYQNIRVIEEELLIHGIPVFEPPYDNK